jgi:hypothetical protein
MDSIRRENDKTPAIGNMPVNARGDQIKGGQITKTADQIARENHRVQSTIVSTGLKGPIPASPESPILETPKPTATAPAKPVPKVKEKELPSGDIIIESDSNEG